MAHQRHGYINVDELLPQVTLEQVAAYYAAPLPDLKRVGEEVRTRCFLLCGRRGETGDRALAIKVEDPVKRWRCHQYGCGKGGNLVSLCDLLKPGGNGEGRPRGERFKQIAADLRAMVEGVTRDPAPAPAAPPDNPPAAEPRDPVQDIQNIPLARSPNERARGLVNLDQKFLTDPAEMNAKAAAYFRRRPFLSSEACRKWRVGYLSHSTGGDKAGGTMRGKVVYPLQSERGEVLTWFGRDPDFESKRAQWEAQGRAGREPQKFHFVKGFHRGLELFGQQAERLREPGYREAIAELGIIVVEGPNDVIALDALGAPAVGLCSNTITDAQVEKIARWAEQLSDGKVTLMLDCDEEGMNGAQQALMLLAAHCRVRLAWTMESFGGAFRGRQPESLRREEWETLRRSLAR